MADTVSLPSVMVTEMDAVGLIVWVSVKVGVASDSETDRLLDGELVLELDSVPPVTEAVELRESVSVMGRVSVSESVRDWESLAVMVSLLVPLREGEAEGVPLVCDSLPVEDWVKVAESWEVVRDWLTVMSWEALTVLEPLLSVKESDREGLSSDRLTD